MPTGVPPQLPEYHFHDAPVPSDPPETVKVDEFPGQTELGFAFAPVGAVELDAL